jgi:CRP-like cAMP-binding protein
MLVCPPKEPRASWPDAEPTVRQLDGHGLLAGLPLKDRRRIAKKLHSVILAEGKLPYEPDGVIREVFFPLSAVFSLSGMTSEGGEVEIVQIGSEGIAGVEVALRTKFSEQPLVHTRVQIPGAALCMTAEQFADEVDQSPAVNRSVRRYMGFFFAQLQLFTACNRHHTLEQRCARRLLTAQDLAGRPDVRMTQHHLAQLLGVSRQSVDRVLQHLGDRDILGLKRGGVRIHSRQQLKGLSCRCYRVAKKELSDFLAVS